MVCHLKYINSNEIVQHNELSKKKMNQDEKKFHYVSKRARLLAIIIIVCVDGQ